MHVYFRRRVDMIDWYDRTGFTEPTLSELLEDPVIHLLMSSDGRTRSSFARYSQIFTPDSFGTRRHPSGQGESSSGVRSNNPFFRRV